MVTDTEVNPPTGRTALPDLVEMYRRMRLIREFETRTADAHNGADQAMAVDLLAAMEARAAFPVTPYESLEAGLTVMAIDRALEERQVVDCAPMWARYDAALSGAQQGRAEEVL